jgi:hypothetical protein
MGGGRIGKIERRINRLMTLAAKGKLFTTCELTAAIYANPKWAGCTTGFAWRLLHLRIALAAPMLEGAPGCGAFDQGLSFGRMCGPGRRASNEAAG